MLVDELNMLVERLKVIHRTGHISYLIESACHRSAFSLTLAMLCSCASRITVHRLWQCTTIVFTIQPYLLKWPMTLLNCCK